jgi:hypothetical protein
VRTSLTAREIVAGVLGFVLVAACSISVIAWQG